MSALKNSEGYISGEQISAELGITRSAVWKYINALKADGYQIDSVRNKGYKLVAAPERLDHDEICSRLHTSLIGKEIIVLDIVDSTNEEVKRLAAKGGENGSVVTAEQQTAGKGRFGRVWSSDNGGLYFTVLLKPNLPPSDIASITLASGYAVCQAIIAYTGLQARVKWPNDIIIGTKKVCGILTEMAAQSDRIDYVAIGIGINLNHTEFPRPIDKKATSLLIETGKRIDKNDFLAVVLGYLDKVITDFCVSLSVDDLKNFKAVCATLGRQVTVERGSSVIKGVAVDITSSGELVVTDENGTEVIVGSGEVTVQGIY